MARIILCIDDALNCTDVARGISRIQAAASRAPAPRDRAGFAAKAVLAMVETMLSPGR